jgi:hypothetical protein
LEGRARRAPSGKRDFVSHFGSSGERVVVVVEKRGSASREKKRRSRDLVTGRAQEHLVKTGICHLI